MRRAVMATAAFALVGCSGGGDATPTTAPTTTAPVATVSPVAASTVPIGEVFADLTAGDAAALRQLAAVVVPGSAADLYVRYLTAARRLTGAAGCTAECPVYSAPEHDPARGLLAGFEVDGLGLAGRITGAGPTVPAGDLAVHVAGAYRTADDDVYVVVGATNAGESAVELFGFAAVYQPPGSASAADASAWWGEAVVPAGGSTQLLIEFTGAGALGGTLDVSGVDADGVDVAVRLATPDP